MTISLTTSFSNITFILDMQPFIYSPFFLHQFSHHMAEKTNVGLNECQI
jgi:hypothetical protein